MKDFREQLILQIANGVAIKNGIDVNPMYIDTAATAIITMADKIIKEMNKKED